MRDPQRCPVVANRIATLWQEKCPDWRFGQLMYNFLAWLGRDPFYMEDDEFMAEFRKFIDTIERY